VKRSAFVPAAVVAVAVSSAAVFGVAPSSAGVGTHPFATAIYPGVSASEDPVDADLTMRRIHAAGGTFVRLGIPWSEMAPRQPANPADPGDAAYDFMAMDTVVEAAVAAGLQPMVTVWGAPPWAERGPALPGWDGSGDPDPAQIALFAHALAVRYSGRYRALPVVRYWSAWNEPNLSIYYNPQFLNGTPASPLWYRDTLNRFYDAVHSVDPRNVVIAGETAPYRDITTEVLELRSDWGPLSFMRELFCLSSDLKRLPTCPAPVRFDVWAHHPYTSGGPTHHAFCSDDVSLGDLPRLRRTLDAAVAAGRVRSTRPVRLWVTEFDWPSEGPDAGGWPASLLTRWVPESMYRMWQSGVDLLAWFSLRGNAGLYTAGATVAEDRPKPYMQGFRFPFVALRQGAKVRVWARTPYGTQQKVTIEQQMRDRWRILAIVPADKYGIVQTKVTPRSRQPMRARIGAERSLAFSLVPVPDRDFDPSNLDGPERGPCAQAR
jgi:hypothetical protein